MLDCSHCRLDETVVCRKLSERLTTYARNVVLKMRIAETADDLVDICEMSIMVETVFCYETLTALLHCSLDDSVDFLVCDAVSDCAQTLELAEICSDCVTCIQSEELALDVCDEIVGKVHSLHLKVTLDRSSLHIPLIELLHNHVDRILALDRRNDTVNRTVRESNILVSICLLLICKMAVDMLLELRRSTKTVLTCNYVEVLCNTLSLTLCNTSSKSSCNTRKNTQTYCSCHNLSLSNLLCKFRAA